MLTSELFSAIAARLDTIDATEGATDEELAIIETNHREAVAMLRQLEAMDPTSWRALGLRAAATFVKAYDRLG